MKVDYLKLIDKYYESNKPLKYVLLEHSRSVARKSIEIVRKHPELNIDVEFVEVGAMLHDIGIYLTHAPSILCNGEAPYLLHGYLGGQLLRNEGLLSFARIAERHTGTGLSKETILELKLDMPAIDYFPETLEEKLICYADKFYSKSNLDLENTFEQVCNSLSKFGEKNLNDFLEWHNIFK